MATQPRPQSAAPTSPDQQSIDEIDIAIRTLARQMNIETYRMLMLVREFDDRLGWQKWGLRSCAEWLAWRCELSLSAARERVRTAHALRAMPAISAAFADGRLSYSKVRALTRVVEYHDEESLLEYALQVSAERVEERCRELRNAAPSSITTAWRAWEHRSLVLSRDPARGMMRITIEVPIEDGEVIASAIERVADAGDAAVGLEFAAACKTAGVQEQGGAAANSWQARQADALLAIAKASLAGGDAGPSNDVDRTRSETTIGARSASVADHYQVVVHVDDSALRGGRGRSDLPIDTVKRLACDCSMITVVEDNRGKPLDVGRKQRKVSTPLRRALWSRDRGCIFPGCCNTRYVDAHHIRHWIDGGETNLENLSLVCWHHHRLLHEGGFEMRRDVDDEFYFVRPDGRVVPRCGYRLEDMVDDFVVPDACPSAEELTASPQYSLADVADVANAARSARAPQPSAEVREERGAYRIDRSIRAA